MRLALLGLAYVLRLHIGEALLWGSARMRGSGCLGVAITIPVLALWTMVPMLPIWPLEVLLGHVFVLHTAFLVSVAGKTLGACFAFALANKAKEPVQRMLHRHRRLRLPPDDHQRGVAAL